MNTERILDALFSDTAEKIINIGSWLIGGAFVLFIAFYIFTVFAAYASR
jgi:hypothetical protein